MQMMNANGTDPMYHPDQDPNVAKINAQGTANNGTQQLGFYNQQKLQQPQLDLQRYLGDQSNATNRYVTDQQQQTARQGNQLQYDASVLPANLKQQRFGAVLPYFQQAFSSFNAPQQGSGFGQQPAITTGGVYDQGQIQQQVNAARAGNDQTAATQINKMRGDVSGRGYGANSPLAAALEANYQGKAMAANTSNEREIRQGAATANATQNLNSQQAAESQFEARQNEDIQRRKAQQQAMGTWLGAIGSIS